MLFNSMEFIAFFIIVLLLYYIFPKKIRFICLLVTSYLFYMAWNAKYVILLLTVTLITYFSGLSIDRVIKIKGRSIKKICKVILIVTVLINIGMLIYFKYTNFFLDIFNVALKKVNIEITMPEYDILLPVGISFITFQSLGYVVDVYCQKIRVEKNFLRYALFIAFFPQLVAGPIERSENLLKQIQGIYLKKRISYEKFTNGFVLMIYGYFQKVFLADKLAIIVNTVFAAPEQYTSIELVIAAITFSLQIYCDFGGYSNIAIGAAQMLGFEMMENFNAPYLSRSIKEFWRRWHISLSSWFRDYVYIPMGGSRCRKTRNYINLLVTFLISGLWHGAAMHYVFWGGLHGFYQIIESEGAKIVEKINLKIKKDVFSYKLLQVIWTNFLVVIAWVFFRASSVEQGFVYVKRMFSNVDFSILFDGTIYTLGLVQNDFIVLCIGIIILFGVEIIRYREDVRIDEYLNSQNLWFKWFVLLGFILCIVIFGEYGINYNPAEFIYFQF